MRIFNLTGRKLVPAVAALALVAGLATPASAAAATFSSISRSPDNPTPSAAGVTDTFTVGGATTTQTIGCITVEYSTSTAGSAAIPGFTAASATGASSLFTGLTTTRTASTVTMKPGTAATPSSASGTFTLGGLTNGNTADTTYYAIVKTWTDAGCTTLQDSGVVGFVYTNGTTVSVTVDPTLTFNVASRATACGSQAGLAGSTYVAPASGTSVDLGRINQSKVGSGAHDLAVGTNANGGVKIYVRGANASANLRAGSTQPFVDSATAPAAGTATFSYTTQANGWNALNATNTIVAQSANLGANGCIGFSAAAAAATPAGAYAASVFYTAVPTF